MINAGANRIRLKIKGRGSIRYAATLTGFSPDLKDPKRCPYPFVAGRGYFHDRLSYRDVPLGNNSTSPVRSLEIGQRLRVLVKIMNTQRHLQTGYLVYEEKLPAGTLLVEGSLGGNFKRSEIDGSTIILYYARRHRRPQL